MSTSKVGSIIAGISLGLIIGFMTAPFLKTQKSSWKLIPFDGTKGLKFYSNVNYPAYLLNEDTGKVILIGDMASDSDSDGKIDTWDLYNQVLYRGN